MKLYPIDNVNPWDGSDGLPCLDINCKNKSVKKSILDIIRPFCSNFGIIAIYDFDDKLSLVFDYKFHRENFMGNVVTIQDLAGIEWQYLSLNKFEQMDTFVNGCKQIAIELDYKGLQSGFKPAMWSPELASYIQADEDAVFASAHAILGLTHTEMKLPWEEDKMRYEKEKEEKNYSIESQIVTVHFNVEDGITTIKWVDGSISQAKCGPNDLFDPERGIETAFFNHFFQTKTDARKFKEKWIEKKYKPKDETYSKSIYTLLEGFKIKNG